MSEGTKIGVDFGSQQDMSAIFIKHPSGRTEAVFEGEVMYDLLVQHIDTIQSQADRIAELEQPWVSATKELPFLGKKILLSIRGVVQEEVFYLDQGDTSDYAPPEYFWDREELEEGLPVADDHKWMPLPASPDKAVEEDRLCNRELNPDNYPAELGDY